MWRPSPFPSRALGLARGRTCSTLAMVVACLAARPAYAGDAAPTPAPARLVFAEASAGFGAPLGWLGASLVLRPSDRIATHVGVGLGTRGPQLSLGARASMPMGTRALGLGLALSSGAYAAPDEGIYLVGGRGHRIYSWDRAQTLSLEVSTESRWSREERLSLRPFVGLGYVLNGGDGLCITGGYAECSGPGIARFIPYAGIALAFGIL